MSEHYFLIKKDTEKGVWEWDLIRENEVMPRSIHLTDEDTWTSATGANNKRLVAMDNELCEELGLGLAYMNNKGKKGGQ